MNERDFSIPKEYRRTVSRAEIFAERLNEYRRSIPTGPINTWAEVIEGQRARVRSLKAIERLRGKLTEFCDSAPDLSNSMLSLQHDVARLTVADDEIGLGEERWDYNSKISQFRRVKRYESDRLGGFADFEGLLKESDKLPTNNRLFINTEDRQIVFADRLVSIKPDRDWEVFLHIVRNRNSVSKPTDIERIARDSGATDSSASYNSIRRLRRLLEVDPDHPEIITTINPGRDASYNFGLIDVRFYRPSEEVRPEAVNFVKRGNVVDIDAFKRRIESRKRRGEILKRDDAFYGHVQALSEVYNQAVEEHKLPSDKLASLDQVASVFSGLNIDFIWEMQNKGFIAPIMRKKGDPHPGFSKSETIYLAYLKRYGLQLSLPKNLINELSLMVRRNVENLDLNNVVSR